MDSIKLTKNSVSNIVEAAGIALEHIPMTFSASDRAPGRKVFFPLRMKKSPRCVSDFVYFYAESKLANPPQDMKNGFTDIDVVDESGVYLFHKDGTGCAYLLDEFLTNVIADPFLKNRIVGRLDEMQQMIHLDDDFLEAANHEWEAIHKNPQSFGIVRLN